MIEIHAALALVETALARAPAAELERLVAADVQLAAAEVRQQLGVQRAHECDTVRCRGERRTRARAAFAQLRERRVARVLQPALHVAEAVLVRNELDAARRAPAVDRANLLRRERRRVAPHVRVVAVRKGVFRVELELVHAQPLEQIDDLGHGRHRRNAVTRDVQHVAALGELRPVADAQTRQGRVALERDLQQRAGAPVQPARVARRDLDPGVVDDQLEALGRQRQRLVDAQLDPRAQPREPLFRARGERVACARLGDRGRAPERTDPRLERELARAGQEVELTFHASPLLYCRQRRTS